MTAIEVNTDKYAEIYPVDIAWIMLNNLDKFDDKPDLIRSVTDLFESLKDHSLFYTFTPMYKEACSYYDIHGKFPDLTYIDSRFPDGRMIRVMNHSDFSMSMYNQLQKQLRYEYMIQQFNQVIGSRSEINVDACRHFSKELSLFADSAENTPQMTKRDWIDSYDDFIAEYHGLSTGNKTLDNEIGMMNGLITIAAPSGNGKSTFALSLTYNIATQIDSITKRGGNVLYISFEMTQFQIMANLAAIESSFSPNASERLEATKIKEGKLSPEEHALYKKHMGKFLDRLNYSGGYVTIVDNTAMKGDTIDSFLNIIEDMSAEKGIKYDIIFIDNVDSLSIYKGDKGMDDMGKMNSFITKLDSFSKTYMDGYGTTVVLLSQTNRDGLKKLQSMESNGSENISIDYTVLQRYSALYERATMVLVLYSSPSMRSLGQLKIMPVKLRNKQLPQRPITLTTKWEHSYVGGNYVPPNPEDEATIDMMANMSIDDLDIENDL